MEITVLTLSQISKSSISNLQQHITKCFTFPKCKNGNYTNRIELIAEYKLHFLKPREDIYLKQLKLSFTSATQLESNNFNAYLQGQINPPTGPGTFILRAPLSATE